MTHPTPGPLGSTMSDTVAKVMEFAAASGNPMPRTGVDADPVEVEVMKADGAIRVRATPDAVVSVEFGEAFRRDPNAMAAQLAAAVNEALGKARAAAMEELRGMPGPEELRSAVASLQNEVLASYRTEMARLEDLTKGIAER